MNVGHSTDGHKQPELNQILQQVGLGWAQVKIIACAGGVWACDGGLLLIIGAVMHNLTEEWGLNTVERGMLVSLVFLGVILGNLIGGPFADLVGRRVPLLLSYLGVFIFSLGSSFSWDFATMAWLRFFVGISFSLGQPAFNALCTECVPSQYRLHMFVVAYSFFAVGEIFSGALLYNDDMYLQTLHWRRLMFLGGVPAGVMFFVAAAFLQESPFFLAMNGQTAKAKQVLETFRKDNGKPESLDVSFAPLPVESSGAGLGLFDKYRLIFSRRMWFTTFVTSVSCFTLNFLFYGSLYAYPQFLPASGESGSVPAATLVWASVSELPGNAAGLLFGIYVTRKLSMQVFCLCSFLVTMVLAVTVKFAVGVEEIPYSVGLLLRTAINCDKLFTTMGFCIVYLYSVEVYSTKARATGTGFCMAFGRFGAIISPIIYELLTGADGNPFDFFCFMAVLCLVNYALLFFLVGDPPPDDPAKDPAKYGTDEERRPLIA